MFFPLFLTLFGCIDAIYCQPLIFLDYIKTSVHLLQRIKWKNTIAKAYCTRFVWNLTAQQCSAKLCCVYVRIQSTDGFVYLCQFQAQSKAVYLLSDVFFHFQKRHQTDRESFISQRFFPFQHLVDFNANYHNQRIDEIFFSLFNIGLLILCLFLFYSHYISFPLSLSLSLSICRPPFTMLNMNKQTRKKIGKHKYAPNS